MVDMQHSLPTVALASCHASCSVSHSISNDLRNWLCCVANAQADDASIRVCLLMLTAPLCNLHRPKLVTQNLKHVRTMEGACGVTLTSGNK